MSTDYTYKKNFQLESQENALPLNRPQAPRSISAADADRDSNIGRNDVPYNPGGEGHAGRCGADLAVN